MKGGKSTKYLIILLMFLIIFGISFNIKGSNNDGWMHTKTGQYIIENNELPKTDLYSHTAPDHEWVLHEWLAQVIFGFIYNTLGLFGLILLKALVITATFAVIFSLISTNIYLASILTLVAAFMTMYHAFMRPHIFSWLFLAAIIWILKKRKFYWLLPFIMLLWTNIHSSVILGIGIIALYLGERFYKTWDAKFIVIGIASLIAAVINPYTYKIFLFPFTVMGFSAYLAEWVPFEVSRPMFWAFLILVFVTFWFILKHKRIDLVDVALFLAFVYLGFSSRRHVAIAVIFIIPLLAPRLWAWAKQFEMTKPSAAGNLVFSLALIALLASSIISLNAFNQEFPERNYPIKALQFLDKNNIRGNMYNDMGFGGFTIFSSNRKVFIDGRVDMYGGDILYAYYLIKNAMEGWEAAVDKYDVSIFMIKHDGKIDSVLAKTPGWKLVFFNELSSVFIKDSEEYKGIPSFNIIGPYSFDIPKDEAGVNNIIKEFEYLESLDPENPEVYRNLGVIYAIATDDTDSALEYINKYLEMEPKGSPEIKQLKSQIERGVKVRMY